MKGLMAYWFADFRRT